MRILVVDDDEIVRTLTVRMLERTGFGGHAIEQAVDGVEALAAVRRRAPDLILCDWDMPKMKGIELLEVLNGERFEGHFCFVTSECTDDFRARAAPAGASAFITKPFTAQDLREVLTPLIDALAAR